VRSAEWIAIVYFAVLAVAALTRPLPSSRRVANLLTSVAMLFVVAGTARWGSSVVRDLAPLLVILVGYYLSGQFFIQPSLPLERWLMRWDRRLFGDPATRFAAWPRTWTTLLESAYVATFLVLPLGCATLFAGGHEPAVSRYWTIVTAAEFGAFAPLAFIQSRPPWALEPARQHDPAALRRFGLFWVKRTSHCANTFPSGHAAGSLAVAFGVLPVMPIAGGALLALAIAICVASVVGRYHYAVDVVAGAALAVAIAAAVWLSGM
jgi:membrane-associated phospholipid phosphatase